ncbi:MAG: bifunctional diguanylate cyclase/phosphodiesterase [Pseudomonadota bacterium]
MLTSPSSLPDFQAILLDRLLRDHALSVVFQPIADLRGRVIHGFEALVRGPEGTPLHAPAALFAAARELGRLAELDRRCVLTALETFSRQALPGLLFLNVSQTLFDAGWLSSEDMLDHLQSLGLEPSRLVFELLETDDLQVDTRAFEEAQTLNRLGFALALDDIGQGYGRLRLWQRLQPRYLKIDREFIDGMAEDPIKSAFVRSVLTLAEASRSWVIAEGVEHLRDLQALRAAGVPMAQGYAIARPVAQPALDLNHVVVEAVEGAKPGSPMRAAQTSIERSALGLARAIAPVAPQTRLEELLRRFDKQPDLMSVPVVDAQGMALGILNRYVLADRLWRPHVRDLLGNKPCALVMSSDVLRLDIKSSLQQASDLIADSSYRHATEGVLMTENGHYRGLLLVGDLLRLVTEFQMQAARYANPLSLLPGNVPINDHIDRLLEREIAFTAAYCDLDHFKPFNDAYGYRMGDELILQVAKALQAVFSGAEDFVGHVGGDDFIVLGLGEDMPERLRTALQRFDQDSRCCFTDDALKKGGYEAENRRGERQFFTLPTLSIGALQVQPGTFESHRELAAVLVELKKAAKQTPGHSLFIDRRSYTAGRQLPGLGSAYTAPELVGAPGEIPG